MKNYYSMCENPFLRNSLDLAGIIKNNTHNSNSQTEQKVQSYFLKRMPRKITFSWNKANNEEELKKELEKLSYLIFQYILLIDAYIEQNLDNLDEYLVYLFNYTRLLLREYYLKSRTLYNKIINLENKENISALIKFKTDSVKNLNNIDLNADILEDFEKKREAKENLEQYLELDFDSQPLYTFIELNNEFEIKKNQTEEEEIISNLLEKNEITKITDLYEMTLTDFPEAFRDNNNYQLNENNLVISHSFSVFNQYFLENLNRFRTIAPIKNLHWDRRRIYKKLNRNLQKIKIRQWYVNFGKRRPIRLANIKYAKYYIITRNNLNYHGKPYTMTLVDTEDKLKSLYVAFSSPHDSSLFYKQAILNPIYNHRVQRATYSFIDLYFAREKFKNWERTLTPLNKVIECTKKFNKNAVIQNSPVQIIPVIIPDFINYEIMPFNPEIKNSDILWYLDRKLEPNWNLIEDVKTNPVFTKLYSEKGLFLNHEQLKEHINMINERKRILLHTNIFMSL